jgi:hypothetical protein
MKTTLPKLEARLTKGLSTPANARETNAITETRESFSNPCSTACIYQASRSAAAAELQAQEIVKTKADAQLGY